MANVFEFRNVPLAYLITFRGRGTWLHGDKRGSVDRHHNHYGSARLPPNDKRRKLNLVRLKGPKVRLKSDQRAAVERGIRETCQIRNWELWALNVRSNHVHTVVSGRCEPETILIAFKANATRTMREAGCWSYTESPWAERGSKKRLWTEQDVVDAVAYVEYDQGEPLP